MHYKYDNYHDYDYSDTGWQSRLAVVWPVTQVGVEWIQTLWFGRNVSIWR